MFKLFFKVITLAVFLVFLTVAVALWKGGEPFRWVGDGLKIMGKSFSEFGDSVDNFIEGSSEVRENIDKISDALSSDKDEK